MKNETGKIIYEIEDEAPSEAKTVRIAVETLVIVITIIPAEAEREER